MSFEKLLDAFASGKDKTEALASERPEFFRPARRPDNPSKRRLDDLFDEKKTKQVPHLSIISSLLPALTTGAQSRRKSARLGRHKADPREGRDGRRQTN